MRDNVLLPLLVEVYVLCRVGGKREILEGRGFEEGRQLSMGESSDI